MGQVRNILVGPGKLELNPTAGITYSGSQFFDIGFTVDGVDINLEPAMVDVEVDQLGDAAKVIHNTTKVSLKTTMAEATLKNLCYAWGYDPTTNLAGDGLTSDLVLSLAAFSVGAAQERSIRFTGTNPYGFPRIYICTRVISMAASAHSYKRANATVFPVEFRVLPDASRTGTEYGRIIDQYQLGESVPT